MDRENIEIKVYTEGVGWKDTPIHSTHKAESTDHAYQIAKSIADEVKNEVRWNKVGLEQGHYIGTMYKFERLKNK